MKCPSCTRDAVSFGAAWIRSGWGRYTCRHCGVILRTSREPLLFINTASLSGAATILGFLSRSWLVFGALFVWAIGLDAALDWRFRRLALADAESKGDGWPGSVRQWCFVAWILLFVGTLAVGGVEHLRGVSSRESYSIISPVWRVLMFPFREVFPLFVRMVVKLRPDLAADLRAFSPAWKRGVGYALLGAGFGFWVVLFPWIVAKVQRLIQAFREPACL